MTTHCPLDRVVRGTFEWREVANLLTSFGQCLPRIERGAADERVVAECAYKCANRMAHGRQSFAEMLVRLLSRVHQRECADVRAMGLAEIRRLVSSECSDEQVGWLWALVTDPRGEVVSLGKSWAREAVG